MYSITTSSSLQDKNEYNHENSLNLEAIKETDFKNWHGVPGYTSAADAKRMYDGYYSNPYPDAWIATH